MTQTLPPPDAPPIPVLRERDDGSTYWDEIDPIDRAMNANQNLEYVDGRFVEKKVSEESSYLGVAISTRLNIAADFGRLARVYGSDLEYRVWPERPRHSRRPDASVIRLDRVLELPPNPGTLPIVPDLAVEVISPGDEVREVSEKQEEYRKAAFPLVWWVDPFSRFVDVHAQGTIRRLYEDDLLTLPDLLPAFRHTVGDLLGPPRAGA